MGAVDWCPLLSGGFLHGAKISRTVCSHLSSSFQFSRLQKYSNHQIVGFLERIGAEFGACQVRLCGVGAELGVCHVRLGAEFGACQVRPAVTEL